MRRTTHDAGSTRYRGLRPVLAAMLAATSGPAAALTFTVGGDFTCGYDNIQAAVDAAQASPGPDEIRIATNWSYGNQNVLIGQQDAYLTGGYADCWAAQQGWFDPTKVPTISGAGGSEAAVFRVRGSGVKEFHHLAISSGDNLSGSGGGIDYQGTGAVVLADTIVGSNRAARGGGIHARGSGGAALLEIGRNVQIINNTALGDGGGVHVTGNTRMTMTAPDSTIWLNRAPNGAGGGLYLEGPAHAAIGSPGFLGFATIDSNTAVDGGGISVRASTSDAFDHQHLDLFSTDPGRPVRLAENYATYRGGAIYAKGRNTFLDGQTRVHVDLADFIIERNEAPHGAALYLDNESSGSQAAGLVRFGGNATASAGCTVPCNRVVDNDATASDGGAVFRLDADGRIEARGVTFAGNSGTHLVWARGEGLQVPGATLRDCLVVANQAWGALFRASAAQDTLDVGNCTIAGNEIGGADVFEVEHAQGMFKLHQSIVHQPQNHVLFHAGGSAATYLETSYNVGAGVAGLSVADSTSLSAAPRFVDAPRGDYRLRPGSPAVDRAPEPAGEQLDLDRNVRGQDLPTRGDFHGPRDAGVYELRTTANAVANPGFAADLRAWELLATPVAGNPTIVSLDASGVDGTGSVQVLLPAGQTASGQPSTDEVAALRQCVHLPGAGTGTWELSGFAHTGDFAPETHDTPVIEWILRTSSDEGCGGAATLQGELALARGAWASPAARTTIAFPVGAWTPDTSIELRLKVRRRAGDDPATTQLFARFDAITLRTVAPVVVPDLLSHGFED